MCRGLYVHRYNQKSSWVTIALMLLKQCQASNSRVHGVRSACMFHLNDCCAMCSGQ